ncbi:MAG: MFS transporter [Acidimicrobiia bacterium]|nr:MFS transporter [Acidimicrobiia bacterium]
MNSSVPTEARVPTEGSVPARAGLVLVTLITVATVANLNLSVANIALPDIGRHFDASQVELNAVAVGFSLGLAATVLWLGALGDRYGRRSMLLGGLVLSVPASLVAGFAPDVLVLAIARIVGGVAAGMAFPTTLALITALWSGPARTRPIALWSGIGGATMAFGPLVAGGLLLHFWWGSVFLVTIPLAVVAFVASLLLLPAHVNESSGSVDNVGGVLSVVMVGAAVISITIAPEPGLLTASAVIAVIAVVAVVLFVRRQRRVSEPLYDLRVAARRTFWVAAVAGMLVFGALVGAMFIGQQYMQNVLGYSTWSAGLSVLPAAVFMVVGAPVSARLIEWRGSRDALLVGFVIAGLGFVVMILLWRDTASAVVVGLGYSLLGLGVGIAGPPASRSLTESVPVDRAGMASATADLQRDLGGAILQSILGAILTAGYAVAFRAQISSAQTTISDAVTTQLTKSYSGAATIAEQYPQYADQIIAAARQSFVDGQHLAYGVGIVAMVIGIAVVWFGFPAKERENEMVSDYDRADAPA